MHFEAKDLIKTLTDFGLTVESPFREEFLIEEACSFAGFSSGPFLVFYKGKDVSSLKHFEGLNEGCLLVPMMFKSELNEGPFLFVDDPQLAFIYVFECLKIASRTSSIHDSCVIDEHAKISKNVSIGAGAIVGRCEIGEGTVIGKGVIIDDNVIIGKNVNIFNGANIGAPGLGSQIDKTNKQLCFPHIGSVIIEDDVVIGADTIVNKGSLQDTLIKHNTHISGNCFIAHNCEISEHVFIAPNVSLAGSVVVGPNSYLGLGASVVESLVIPPETTIGVGVVVRSIENSDSNLSYINSSKPTVFKNIFSNRRRR